MRTILLLNAKGGCGKSTLATNLACHYALQGKSVVLADLDPQSSSLAWLEARSRERPAIRGLAAFREPLRVPRTTDYVILDAPAGVRGPALTAIVRRAQTIIIPVLPSATDIRAAARFIHELLLVGRVERRETRLATVANRVPEATRLEGAVEQILSSVNIPYASVATQIYRPLERFLARLESRLSRSSATRPITPWRTHRGSASSSSALRAWRATASSGNRSSTGSTAAAACQGRRERDRTPRRVTSAPACGETMKADAVPGEPPAPRW